jgi:hypothetical protein
MRSVNDLDKELIKSDKMNTDVIRDILTEMDSEEIPTPDLAKVRTALFAKDGEGAIRVRSYNRRAAVIFAVAALFTLSACTVLAVHYLPVLYEWITEGSTDKIHTDQMTRYDTVEEAVNHIGINLKTPSVIPEGYLLKTVQDYDWGKFKNLTIQYEKDEKTLTFFAIYEYTSISDVKIIPYDIAAGANMEINGIDVMNMSRDGQGSAAWEIDGVPYLLMGNYTQEELIEIINGIK